MSTAVTRNIKVQVRSTYDQKLSDPRAARFIFTYRITISNHGGHPVRLMRRRWRIVDSLRAPRDISGPGVVGETPLIAPGGSYTYQSHCELRSAFGCMYGDYVMERIDTGTAFSVAIPHFDLVQPITAN